MSDTRPKSSSAMIASKVQDASLSKTSATKDIKIEELSGKEAFKKLTQEGHIPGLSIAMLDKDTIYSTAVGVSETESKKDVTSDTLFWTCSLSKPVFAFLIVKLIDLGYLKKDYLDKNLPWDETILGPQGDKKPLTPRMILSHQSGLPNEGAIKFLFKPGEGFQYSANGYFYLQTMLSKELEEPLETLAQEILFIPLGMKHSTFLFPEEKERAIPHDEVMGLNSIYKGYGTDNHSAASLHTTASDYARFLRECLQNKTFLTMVEPHIKSMEEKDSESKSKNVRSGTLKSIDWGIGIGLEKNDKGEIIAAFHWGEGPGSRSFFTIQLSEDPKAFVYFANSENGLSVAEEIARLTTGQDVSPIITFLSEKYGYSKSSAPEWKHYFEPLFKGIEAEKKGELEKALLSYQAASKIKPNPALNHRIKWTELQLQLQKSKPSISPEKLKELEGQYGGRGPKILVNENKLQIDVGEKFDLVAVDENTFLDEKGKVILTFNRDSSGKVASLECYFKNGIKEPPVSHIPLAPTVALKSQ